MMKYCLPLLTCCLLFTSARAQDRRAIPIEAAELYGYSIAQLDALHGPAVHTDTSLAVFPTRYDEVHEAWRALLTAFSGHLKAEGFTWAEPLRGYFRFYFRPDGAIDRVLYNVRALEGEEATRYGTLLDEFARSYDFGLTADRPFSQCSPATLMPPEADPESSGR